MRPRPKDAGPRHHRRAIPHVCQSQALGLLRAPGPRVLCQRSGTASAQQDGLGQDPEQGAQQSRTSQRVSAISPSVYPHSAYLLTAYHTAPSSPVDPLQAALTAGLEAGLTTFLFDDKTQAEAWSSLASYKQLLVQPTPVTAQPKGGLAATQAVAAPIIDVQTGKQVHTHTGACKSQRAGADTDTFVASQHVIARHL